MLSASTMFAVAIPRNDDLFIVAPLRHSAGINFNTRVTLGRAPLWMRISTRIVVVASSLSNYRSLGSDWG